MNVMVAAYEGELRRTVIQLSAAEKLARARDAAIDRVRGELKEAQDKALEEKEILPGQFEKLEAMLKSSQSTRKKLREENAALKERMASLEEERTAEGKRLRDSRIREVTQERIRVLSAMITKANVRFNNIRDRESRRGEFDIVRNLHGQAMGTKNCLEMILNSGAQLTQEHVDMFAEQERQYSDAVSRLRVEPIPETDLSLSPLILPSQYVDEDALASLDLFGSNMSAINAETVACLQRSDHGADLLVVTTDGTDQSGKVPPLLEESALPETNLEDDPALVISDGSSSEEEGEIGDSPSPLLVNQGEELGETTKVTEAAACAESSKAKDATALGARPEDREG